MKDEQQLQSCAFVHRLFIQEKKICQLRIQNRGAGAKRKYSQKENGLGKK